MNVLNFNRKITDDDVREINASGDCIIQLESTLNQDINIISKINKNCTIKVIPKNIEKYKTIINKPDMAYSVDAFCGILTFLDKLDKTINKEWSDLEKSVYIYTEIQKLSENIKDQFETMYDLSTIVTKNANSQSLASIFYEAMGRQNIPCKFIFNKDNEAWNEVKIGGLYYPVDVYEDTKKYRAALQNTQDKVNPMLDSFAVGGFYENERHQPHQDLGSVITENLNSTKLLSKQDVRDAYNSVQKDISENQVEEPFVMPEPIERKDIKLKSKELAKAFDKGEIIASTYDGKSNITVEVTDEDFGDLIEDLDEIGKYYPELLGTVELKNESNKHINFQDVIDKVYSIKTDNPYVESSSSSIRIATTNPEDFNLDFSKAPKVKRVPKLQSDGEPAYQGIEFINIDPTKPMKLPNFNHSIPKNIESLAFENIDFDGVTVFYDGRQKIKEFKISGTGTQNINYIPGITGAHKIDINSISNGEFDSFMNNVYGTCTVLDKININNQNLRNRKILRELAQKNPNVSMVSVDDSKVNDIDGLEDFDGRIAKCSLNGNELGVSAIERMERFKQTNPYLWYNLMNNSGIINKVHSSNKISDDTHKFIADYISQSGTANVYLNKEQCLNVLLDEGLRPIPIYAKDAHIVRSELKLKRNPMMVKDNSEIDSLNFNSPDMQDGIMLLSIPQIEHLLNSGKVIPQTVRIKIEDVTQLDNKKLEDIENRMTAKGMNISGVQIIDRNNNSNWNMIGPYTLDSYKKVRSQLERLVEGIDPSEPDIDKFVTVYMRIAESIPYDYSVIDRPAMGIAGGLHYSKYIYASRNLEEGLVEGTCVCSGYADIMKNALALVGVDSKTNSGLTHKVNGGGHAWNQVKIDGKWYYCDVTWDEKKSSPNPKNRNYNWILKGRDEFTRNGHEVTSTKKIATVEPNAYPRKKLKDAIARNEHRSFDFTIPDITIEPDPPLNIQLDDQKIKDEYKRRRDDMLAKYYGDKDYRDEYKIRSERFKANETDVTTGGTTYRTINNYAERAEDEAFLFLDGYKNALERSTKFEAGDTSVYAAYGDPDAEYKKDKEYVETRNNTFNQHENTNKDLATLGKYGEKVPYIPKKQGVIKNIGRAVANTGIFVRNITAPAYRFIGKFVGQPIHKLVTRNSDASPYRNNFYHRMVARRAYFEDVAAKRDEQETANLRARASDPSTVKPVSHPIKNAITSRFKAIFNVKEGNKAVLSAGLSDIKNNIMKQEGQKAMISAIQNQVNELTAQITRLENEINTYPTSRNITTAKDELRKKKANLKVVKDRLDVAKAQDKIYSKQTDAIDSRQHSIASKEVNTMRVTAIKGVAKGVAVKLLGPKLKDLILEHSQKNQTVEVPTTSTNTTREWVAPTYKTEVQEIYGDVVDKTSSVKDMMNANKGNSVTGFYSVYGGENGGSIYELVGDEKITGIFKSQPNGGTGLSDTIGLQAPNLTDGTFAENLLNQSGLLDQNISVETLVSALDSNSANLDAIQNFYVALDDKCWVKLSDLLPGITKSQKVDEIVKTVIDTEGYWKTAENITKSVNKVTNVVNNPMVEKGVNMTGDILKGLIIGDGILDLNENLRKTNSSKKKEAKDYEFDDDESRKIPTSRKDYENER